MGKSGEHFIRVRSEEELRDALELDRVNYAEVLYLRDLKTLKLNPAQGAIKPKEDAHSTIERTSK